MEIVAQTELVSINATMIVQVVSFLIFLFLIQRIMFRPLLNTMDARSADLKKAERVIKAKESQLAELSSKMQREAAQVKADAFKESENMEAAAREEAHGILAQAQEKIAAQQRIANDDVRRRIETVQRELTKEAETLAAAIMEKILERRLQP